MAEWIIICNAGDYNIEGAFNKFDKIDWKQSTNVEVGDVIYIYVGAPIYRIQYKCIATKVELTESEIDDSEFVINDAEYGGYDRYMELTLEAKYDNNRLGLNQLKLNGLKTVRGPSQVTQELSSYLFSVTETGGNVFDNYYSKSPVNKTRREAITILQRAYNRPVTARELTDIMYEHGKPQANVFTELQFMEDQGLAVKTGSSAPFGYSIVSNTGTPQYFYVFQNRSFNEESQGEYLWAPKLAKDGTENHHWSRMEQVKKGDVIFHGYKQRIVAVSIAKKDAYTADRPTELSEGLWAKKGWKVDSDYYIFPHAISPKDYWDEIKVLQPDKYGPFDKNGSGNVGYLFSITQEMAEFILDATAGKKRLGEDLKSNQNDEEATALLSGKTSIIIENLIKQFTKTIPEILPKEHELEKKRICFVNDYNMKKLINMTKEEYVVGLGRKDSFCYRLETELQELGNIHGATSAKFGLYYGKSGDDTEEKYRYTKKYGENPDDALDEIKEQIVFLRMNGEKKDLEAIRKCTLAPLFRGKILSVFFPEDFLCIFTDEHLDYFMQKLEITISSNDDILTKQLKLIEWKNSRIEMQEWNNHLFSRFLYSSFGRPLEDEKTKKDIQAEKDKSYPREYVTKIGITIGQWKALLQNPDVFKLEDVALLKRFYRAENHATTCYDLGIQDGLSPSAYITPIVSLSKRISETLELDPIYGDEGKQVWWRIPFWGRYREDGRFEWKLRPKLAKAMVAIYPELINTADQEMEAQEDKGLIEELRQANVTTENFEYIGKPKLKTAPVYKNGHKTYPRDRQVAINALAHAHYECEVDASHLTFIRKKSEKKYTEPHHLIPMAFSDEFEVSLDVEENIVSLCSNCHNLIHYGKDANILITQLYEERKTVLENVGINITLGRLLSMYGYEDV